jgi:hypothetical protein
MRIWIGSMRGPLCFRCRIWWAGNAWGCMMRLANVRRRRACTVVSLKCNSDVVYGELVPIDGTTGSVLSWKKLQSSLSCDIEGRPSTSPRIRVSSGGMMCPDTNIYSFQPEHAMTILRKLPLGTSWVQWSWALKCGALGKRSLY